MKKKAADSGWEMAPLLAHEKTKTKIHTIGFNMVEGSKAAKDFEAIAR